ncbi:hypothetical protein [Cohnella abietis]|nr:hypothetical protein [Cohnella abietis]
MVVLGLVLHVVGDLLEGWATAGGDIGLLVGGLASGQALYDFF